MRKSALAMLRESHGLYAGKDDEDHSGITLIAD